jgi:hypothetical protein
MTETLTARDFLQRPRNNSTKSSSVQRLRLGGMYSTAKKWRQRLGMVAIKCGTSANAWLRRIATGEAHHERPQNHIATSQQFSNLRA